MRYRFFEATDTILLSRIVAVRSEKHISNKCYFFRSSNLNYVGENLVEVIIYSKLLQKLSYPYSIKNDC